jgi:hypothetical protein
MLYIYNVIIYIYMYICYMIWNHMIYIYNIYIYLFQSQRSEIRVRRIFS